MSGPCLDLFQEKVAPAQTRQLSFEARVVVEAVLSRDLPFADPLKEVDFGNITLVRRRLSGRLLPCLNKLLVRATQVDKVVGKDLHVVLLNHVGLCHRVGTVSDMAELHVEPTSPLRQQPAFPAV